MFKQSVYVCKETYLKGQGGDWRGKEQKETLFLFCLRGDCVIWDEGEETCWGVFKRRLRH